MTAFEENFYIRFAGKVLVPKLPPVSVLEKSIKGMTRQIKQEKDQAKKDRLIEIRAEFQDLIDRM